MNPYDVGIGSTAVIWLNVIVLAILWRAASIWFACSNSPRLQTLGAAMGASL